MGAGCRPAKVFIDPVSAHVGNVVVGLQVLIMQLLRNIDRDSFVDGMDYPGNQVDVKLDLGIILEMLDLHVATSVVYCVYYFYIDHTICQVKNPKL